MLSSKILFDLISIFIGLIFGSFINVVVYRLPKNQSIIRPRSFCPRCKKMILWHQNIPIFSWLILRGKCSNCKKVISPKYPVVEAFTGILFFISITNLPSNINIMEYIFLILTGWGIILILLSISIIDYYHLWIPNSIIKIAVVFGFFISIFSSIINNQNLLINIIECVISGLLGYLIIIAIMQIGELIFKKPSMGLGDAKLTGVLGLWFGFPGVLVVIWLSFLLAGGFIVFGLISKTIFKGQLIPFGPFLSMSGFLIWLFGEDFFLRFFLN